MILKSEAYCRTCGYEQKGQCIRWGHPVDKDKDFCSEHRRGLLICGICGQPMLTEGSIIYPEGEEIKIICVNCYNNKKMEVSQ